MIMKKGKRAYCYRSYRQDGTVAKQYLGEATSEAAQQLIQTLTQNNIVREERKKDNTTLEHLTNTLDDLRSMTDILLRCYLIEQGYFKRKSEIRRIYYAD